jgi:hypothetical protein
MKIIIIGKRNQMGTTPNIRIKGMSQVRYNFLWDPEIRHYAYEPKGQKEADDIFRTQGKISHTIFYSVWLDPEIEPEPEIEMIGTKIEKAPKRKKKAKSRQPVPA